MSPNKPNNQTSKTSDDESVQQPFHQPELTTTLEKLLANSSFKGKHVLSVSQYRRSELSELLATAQEMRAAAQKDGIVGVLRGFVLGEICYEPSTRTTTSFVSAMKRVGGQTLLLSKPHSSSQEEQSVEDTVRTVGCYCDAIVLRHPDEEAPNIAANGSEIPIINGGNNAKEHLTQALVDIFTIHEEMGKIDGLTVTFVGDLKYGRTVHSLCELLKFYRVTVNLCSLPSLEMPSELREQLKNRGRLGIESNELAVEIVGSSDVLYCTRTKKERFEDLQLYEQVKNSLLVDTEVMKHAKRKMVLMHPLPRNKEIPREVDYDPRAAYIRQMEYGLYCRMALLALILAPKDLEESRRCAENGARCAMWAYTTPTEPGFFSEHMWNPSS